MQEGNCRPHAAQMLSPKAGTCRNGTGSVPNQRREPPSPVCSPRRRTPASRALRCLRCAGLVRVPPATVAAERRWNRGSCSALLAVPGFFPGYSHSVSPFPRLPDAPHTSAPFNSGTRDRWSFAMSVPSLSPARQKFTQGTKHQCIITCISQLHRRSPVSSPRGKEWNATQMPRTYSPSGGCY